MEKTIHSVLQNSIIVLFIVIRLFIIKFIATKLFWILCSLKKFNIKFVINKNKFQNQFNYCSINFIRLFFHLFRFNIFLHDKVKRELLTEHIRDPAKQEFIERLSTPGYEYLPTLQQQRFIKTHLPFSLMPPSVMDQNAKVWI